MKRFKSFLPAALCAALVLSQAAPAAAATASQDKPKHLRLFAPSKAGEKRYYTGYDWLQFKLNQKIQLIETARSGAARMGVVMTQPAELYIRELDRMFQSNPQVQHMELGQAIEGTAIVLKDWDDGTDPEKKLQEFTSKVTGSPASSGK